MIDKSKLSDKPIPGILEAYFPYGREQGPVPPGIYRVRIVQISEVKPDWGTGVSQKSTTAFPFLDNG